jgi:hypothetical protein
MRFVTLLGIIGLLAGCFDQTGPSVSSSKDINTYEDCLIAGGIIQESYPAVCHINGQFYEQDISTGNTGDKREIRFLVDPQTVTCQGFHPIDQKCLIVNGGNFFEEIEGYTHQEGVGRILRVERTQICNPDVLNSCPQDVSIYRYRLLEIEK